ncbi:MAG: hypothetical protein PHC75_10825 [Burkholderiales bacterium]|nr:hypothetical protein [Burkholderiales bacterium]
MKNEEIKLLDIQMVATIIFIASLIISLLLIYNEKLKLLKLKTIFGNKEEQDINIINRIVVLILALVFLYANYKDYELSKTPNELKYNSLELFSSCLITIASIIILYVVVNSEGEDGDLISLQNPTI